MRLTTLAVDGATRLGVVDQDRVVDVARACARRRGTDEQDLPSDLVSWLRRNGDRAAIAEEALAYARGGAADSDVVFGLDAVRFAPLNPEPRKLICIGRNYADHVAEASRPLPEVPVCFAGFADSLIGHGEDIRRPSASHELDWEGELAVVIGSDCRPTTADEAMAAIGGYSIFNDVSLRDYQQRGVQWTAGKNFWATSGLGPWLVTADEIPDPQALTLTTRVNGAVVQDARTSDMIFDVATIILHIAEWTPLCAGDVVATGTPSGVGFVRTPPWFLVPGDEVEVEIEKVGVLRNGVVDA